MVWKAPMFLESRGNLSGWGESGKFHEMTPKKQIDFIEKVAKSRLGLDGMKIVVMCDRCRQGEFPKDVDLIK